MDFFHGSNISWSLWILFFFCKLYSAGNITKFPIHKILICVNTSGKSSYNKNGFPKYYNNVISDFSCFFMNDKKPSKTFSYLLYRECYVYVSTYLQTFNVLLCFVTAKYNSYFIFKN